MSTGFFLNTYTVLPRVHKKTNKYVSHKILNKVFSYEERHHHKMIIKNYNVKLSGILNIFMAALLTYSPTVKKWAGLQGRI